MTGRAWGRLFGALALAWAGLIFWESSQSNPFPFLPLEILSQDKLLHVAAYAVLAGLVMAAIARGRPGPLVRAAAVAILFTAAYGATDEWHQWYVPGRDADPLDWVADVTGAIAGATAVAVILRRRDPRASIRP